MPQANAPLYAMNCGEVSRLALARVDLAKMRLAAEQQENLLPKVLGPAIMRPGTQYLAGTNNNSYGRVEPFVFNATTKALLELTHQAMRVLIDGVLLTRPSVSAAVTNGAFTSDLSGWTDSDEAGATSQWAAGMMELIGTGSNYAVRTQQVTVSNAGVEHALRVQVSRATITMRVGSTLGGDEYVSETSLRTGDHSIAFTPAGNFYIWFGNRDNTTARIADVNVEAAGIMVLPTPWGLTDLPNYRQKQSGDVMFTACAGIQQRRIERRSQRSWSIVLYEPPDGPFRLPNTGDVTLRPAATSGYTQLTASRGIFKPSHVGALFKIVHSGQQAVASLAGVSQASDPVRVSGLTADRGFVIDITGTFVGTIVLQRSLGAPGSWTDIAGSTWSAPTSEPYNDSLDNQIIYYRLKMTAFTSGVATVTLSYANSSQSGIIRVTDYVSSTQVYGTVLATFGAASASTDWQEGEWSSYRGYPSCLDFHDGRLIFGGKDKVYASVSDAFESYDEDVEGDSAPFVRSIATGSFDAIYWMLSLQRLLAGTAGQEVSIRSSSFDEPLTPTKFTARKCSSRGNANVQAVSVDSNAIFVQRSGKRVFELKFSSEGGDYASSDLTRLKPEMCQARVDGMTVQRQPDTRIWVWLQDGTVAVLTYERADEVIAWTKFSMTSGLVKSMAVLPGADEDEVYFVVQRTIGGVAKYYIERLAMESEVTGGTLNKVMDSHIVYSGGATTTINGLSHLEGQQVIVWADGAPMVTQASMLTVSGGAVTLPSAVTNAVVGLPYNGRLKSAKLSFAAGSGTALAQKQRVDHLALLMANVGWKGVRIGRDFANLTGLNTTYEGRSLGASEVLSSYDQDASSFGGSWDTDSRICVDVQAPYPATLLGAVISLKTNDVPASRQQRSSGDAG